MSGKKNRLLKVLMSAALIFALCAGMAPMALAATMNDEGAMVSDKDGVSVEAAATKKLTMPIGTDTPNAKFTFTFTKKSVDGTAIVDPATDTSMPAIDNQELTFTSADTKTENDVIVHIENGAKTVIKETNSIFKDIIWPHAGTYAYTVKETKTGYTPNAKTEKLIYSEAEYEIVAYIREHNNSLYVYAVGSYIRVFDDSNDDGALGEKVDSQLKDPSVEGKYSQMIFTNFYQKTNGEITDPEDPPKPPVTGDPSIFDLSKTVASASGDKTKLFKFEVTVNNPTIDTVSTIYKANIYEGTTLVEPTAANVNPAANIKSKGTDKWIQFTTGDMVEISLKHGQRLVFADLWVGSSFEVNEPGNANYLPSYLLTINGTPGAKTEADKYGDPLAVTETYIGEKSNKADYTNTHELTAPMGVTVDNLPYITLIGVAILSLAGYIAFSMKKRAKREM